MIAPCSCPYDHIWSGGYSGTRRAHGDVMKTSYLIIHEGLVLQVDSYFDSFGCALQMMLTPRMP